MYSAPERAWPEPRERYRMAAASAMSGGAVSPFSLETVLAGFNADAQGVTNVIPTRFDFEEGEEERGGSQYSALVSFLRAGAVDSRYSKP